MKLKCKVLTKTEACTHAYYCNRLPEITIDIPDYDPEIHEDEYEDKITI